MSETNLPQSAPPIEALSPHEAQDLSNRIEAAISTGALRETPQVDGLLEQTQMAAQPSSQAQRDLPKNSEAYNLVRELWTNLNGNLGYTEDKLGLAAVRDEKESVLSSIDRTFDNPQAAAYLTARGKDPVQMSAAVESGNLAEARRGMTDPSLSVMPSQAQRDAARQTTPATVPSMASANAQGQQQALAASRAARL